MTQEADAIRDRVMHNKKTGLIVICSEADGGSRGRIDNSTDELTTAVRERNGYEVTQVITLLCDFYRAVQCIARTFDTRD